MKAIRLEEAEPRLIAPIDAVESVQRKVRDARITRGGGVRERDPRPRDALTLMITERTGDGSLRKVVGFIRPLEQFEPLPLNATNTTPTMTRPRAASGESEGSP